MHPNSDFRPNPPELAEYFVREIGFAAIFAATPDGPRVVHTPILLDDSNRHIRFHIARGNALSRHLNGATALAVVQGPDAYISPSDYRSADQVPTWNYIAVEMEGMVQRLNDEACHEFLADLAAVQENRAGISPAWHRNAMPTAHYDRLFKAIIGFEMPIQAWRPTFKLGQNKSPQERESVAAALETRGHGALAQLMRHLSFDKPQL